MTWLTSLRARLTRFRRSEDGSQSIELVIIFPLLVWVYLGMFTYFDSFRSQSLSDKASYTIADMVSRETGYVTPAYMETLYQLHGLLTRDRNQTQLRVSIVAWNETDNAYSEIWSQRKGGAPELTKSTLRSSGYRQRMPDGLPDGERLILVEAWTIYEPPFQVGLPAVRFETFTVTRPRFSSQVCWNPDNNGDATTATC